MFHTFFDLISISAFCGTVLVFAKLVGG